MVEERTFAAFLWEGFFFPEHPPYFHNPELLGAPGSMKILF